MKKHTNILLSILLVTTILLSISCVSARFDPNNVTWERPAASATLTGAYTFNVTNNTVGGYMQAIVNCTIYAKSAALTANNTWTILGVLTNATALSISRVNGSLNTAVLEDGNDYTLNATCRNVSNDATEKLLSTITIDNTAPTTATSLLPTEDTDGDVTFSSTIVGRETTGCTLYFANNNPGAPSYTMTESGNTCSVSITKIPEQSYNWYVLLTDESQTSSSSSQTTRIVTHSGGGGSSGGGSPSSTSTQQTQLVSQTQLGDGISSGVTIGSKISEVWNNIINFFKGLFNR